MRCRNCNAIMSENSRHRHGTRNSGWDGHATTARLDGDRDRARGLHSVVDPRLSRARARVLPRLGSRSRVPEIIPYLLPSWRTMPLKQSIQWLTCAVASMLGAVTVDWPGTA
jgi:hypothetical protein